MANSRRTRADDDLTEGTSQSKGPSMKTPGDGEVTKQVSGPDPRRTSDRTAVGSADAMQAWVGSGTAEEHDYER